MAGGAEAGQPLGGDLQGGRGDADSRADDRPAEDLGHGQSRHHSSVRRGGASQVCRNIFEDELMRFLKSSGEYRC